MELGFAVRKRLYEDWIITAERDVDYPTDGIAVARWVMGRARMADLQADLSRSLAARGLPPISPTSSTSSKDSNVTSSMNPEGRLKTMGYLRAYLNRRTADAPATPSLIGPIAYDRPKKGSADTWNITLDDSVLPRRKDLRQALQIDKQTAQREYRVVGAELVSSVLDYDNEQDWLPKLQQLENDLTFNETSDQGAWLYDLTHLHVHFGIKDKELSLEVVKNVCALYGLFENEIQSWLPITQRGSPFCQRLRLGMEKERLTYNPTMTDVELLPGKRFTPREFTQRLYAVKNLEQLKTEISGWSAGEWVSPTGDGDKPSIDVKDCYPLGAREWVVVNVSLKRENKPLTIEFRHHHGTIYPETIGWW